jgi:hypothetical protein
VRTRWRRVGLQLELCNRLRGAPRLSPMMGARVGDLFGSDSRLLGCQQHQTVTRATGAPAASFNSAGQQRRTRLRHRYCRTARH